MDRDWVLLGGGGFGANLFKGVEGREVEGVDSGLFAVVTHTLVAPQPHPQHMLAGSSRANFFLSQTKFSPKGLVLPGCPLPVTS